MLSSMWYIAHVQITLTESTCTNIIEFFTAFALYVTVLSEEDNCPKKRCACRFRTGTEQLEDCLKQLLVC